MARIFGSRNVHNFSTRSYLKPNKHKMKIVSASLIISLLYSAQAFTPTVVPRKFGVSANVKLTKTALGMAVTKDELKGAQDAIDQILDEKNCGPIFVRLAWHDSGKFHRLLRRVKKK